MAQAMIEAGCPFGQDATVGPSPWLYPSFPTSCPYRVRHGRVPQPTRRYPRLWIDRPSSERPRDLNPPDHNAAQHTVRGAPTPLRPSRRTSLPSLGGTSVAPAFRSPGCRVRQPWAWSWSPGISRRDLPWRRRGLPGSWRTLRERVLLSDPGGIALARPLRRCDAAFRQVNTVGSRDDVDFGAQ